MSKLPMNVIFFAAVLVCFFGREALCLKAMRIRVPSVVKSGDTVTLSCEYDLEQVALYSVKWYRNDEEFYRFVPKESPPYRAFALPHINVDTSKSGPTEVTLRGVRKELSGDYKCEVSADAPLFHTDIKGAHMIVVDLPIGDPVMSIEPSAAKVEIGKKITARCYAPASDPPANITWFINDDQVASNNSATKISRLEVEIDQDLDLKSSKSKLDLTTTRSHFVHGLLTIKCRASIFSIWQQTVGTNVREDSPQLASVLGSTSSQSHTDQVIEIISSNSSSHQLPTKNASFFFSVLTIVVLMR
ncbi:unnamed protein product [Phaedon cochleariae]|uniref:Ig-like domain-containing protein n=1 Tax=Phaedon cochleariae TaxID=80249 RepID=A0A9P0DGQ2_PHACE|nr:unnamed protein product [Phaedon cochleariae]